jgi:hypothetical protein
MKCEFDNQFQLDWLEIEYLKPHFTRYLNQIWDMYWQYGWEIKENIIILNLISMSTRLFVVSQCTYVEVIRL